MTEGFTVTMTGKGGRFRTLIHDELGFATQPYEVCLQEMIFTPGSWGNVRTKANWFIVYDKSTDRSKALFIPPKQYTSTSELLWAINYALSMEYGAVCDMFFYYDASILISMIVFPHPPWKNELLFQLQSQHKRRFRHKDWIDLAVIKETPDMKDRPPIITYGGGKKGTGKLIIQFCQEIAILLGVVDSLSVPIPAILPGWSVNVKDVNILRNNLMMVWIYADFVGTTMLASNRAPLLKTVPIVDDTKSVAHSVFHMHDFVPVQRRRIQSFEVWFQEGPGSSNVLPIDGETILVLYFQHRR
jgi:hypothetical protein